MGGVDLLKDGNSTSDTCAILRLWIGDYLKLNSNRMLICGICHQFDVAHIHFYFIDWNWGVRQSSNSRDKHWTEAK